jgi:transcriptional regulator with XRE-family HTH domain
MAMDQKKLYREIGERIRTRRQQLQRTQGELAATVRLSRPSLANIESGRQNLLVHQLYLFSKSLELLPQDLLPAIDKTLDTEAGSLKLPSDLTDTQQQQIAALLNEIKPVIQNSGATVLRQKKQLSKS